MEVHEETTDAGRICGLQKTKEAHLGPNSLLFFPTIGFGSIFA